MRWFDEWKILHHFVILWWFYHTKNRRIDNNISDIVLHPTRNCQFLPKYLSYWLFERLPYHHHIRLNSLKSTIFIVNLLSCFASRILDDIKHEQCFELFNKEMIVKWIVAHGSGDHMSIIGLFQYENYNFYSCWKWLSSASRLHFQQQKS